MMASLSEQLEVARPSSPEQATDRVAPIDTLLDPEFFKALADPTRAKLLSCLIKCGRPCSVTEVAGCCSVDFSVVARHLAQLARAGVLEARREGRTVWYEAPADALSERFRALAAAIEAWSGDAPCCVATEPRPRAASPGGDGDD